MLPATSTERGRGRRGRRGQGRGGGRGGGRGVGRGGGSRGGGSRGGRGGGRGDGRGDGRGGATTSNDNNNDNDNQPSEAGPASVPADRDGSRQPSHTPGVEGIETPMSNIPSLFSQIPTAETTDNSLTSLFEEEVEDEDERRKARMAEHIKEHLQLPPFAVNSEALVSEGCYLCNYDSRSLLIMPLPTVQYHSNDLPKKQWTRLIRVADFKRQVRVAPQVGVIPPPRPPRSARATPRATPPPPVLRRPRTTDANDSDDEGPAEGYNANSENAKDDETVYLHQIFPYRDGKNKFGMEGFVLGYPIVANDGVYDHKDKPMYCRAWYRPNEPSSAKLVYHSEAERVRRDTELLEENRQKAAKLVTDLEKMEGSLARLVTLRARNQRGRKDWGLARQSQDVRAEISAARREQRKVRKHIVNWESTGCAPFAEADFIPADYRARVVARMTNFYWKRHDKDGNYNIKCGGCSGKAVISVADATVEYCPCRARARERERALQQAREQARLQARGRR